MHASALLLAVVLAAPAGAGDLGLSIVFPREDFSAAAQGGAEPRVVYESGVSAPVDASWDTVLIHGASRDHTIRFEAARAADDPQWVPLEIHWFGNRFWGKARLPKAPGPLRLRALDDGIGAASKLNIYDVEVFLAETGKSSSELTSFSEPPRLLTADPAAPRPPMISRVQWKALPPAGPYTPDPGPWRVTLHHSAGRRTSTAEESAAEALFTQDLHIRGRGWIDIGYHFLVDAEGNILEGRPEETLGAHAEGANQGNVGIVLLGNYHPPINDAPTPAQLEAVGRLGRYLVARYGIDPGSLKGHRDYNQTDCPGDSVYPRLDSLRQAFAHAP